jgi:hypothetical protein
MTLDQVEENFLLDLKRKTILEPGSADHGASTSVTKVVGARYARKLFFDPDASLSDGDPIWSSENDGIKWQQTGEKQSHLISYREIHSSMAQLISTDEKIEQISVYKTPLSQLLPTAALAYHAYIVFSSGGVWWSIEKQNEGVTLQRSVQAL